MAVPTQPTATILATEGLTRFLNGGTPAAADVTRAASYGMEKVKRDIMLLGKTWRPLLKTGFDITAARQAEYANPSDLERDMSASLMIGTHTGTCQAGTTAQATLAAGEDALQTEVQGKWLVFTGGTGVDQATLITSYTVATKVAVFADTLTTAPDATTTYLVVSSVKPLRPIPESMYTLFPHSAAPGEPERYCLRETSGYGNIALQPTPDAVYGLMRRYYCDLMQMDTDTSANPLYATILRRWAPIFEQGIYVWALAQDDTRHQVENAIYQDMLVALMARDLDGYVPESASSGGGQ